MLLNTVTQGPSAGDHMGQDLNSTSHHSTSHPAASGVAKEGQENGLGQSTVLFHTSHRSGEVRNYARTDIVLPVNPNLKSLARRQKLLNNRVENIAESTGWDDVKNLFKPEDRSWIQLRSLAPARFSGLGQRYKTATIEFSCQPSSPNQAPEHEQPPPLVVDKTFEGFTPLNNPKEPIVAE